MRFKRRGIPEALLSWLSFVLILLQIVSCAMKKPPPPPVNFDEDSNRLQQSLFKGDQEILSNQDIERILSSHITLADRHRLAILALNPRVVWSAELADLDAQHSERFLQALRSVPRLTQVRVMPTLLIPEKRTVPYLREAAARFQADMLLVYTTRIQTFRRDRLLGTDEVRARCVAESVLLDVRTGIVAHTAQTAEGITAKKAPGDLTFSETVAKAEGDATGKALLKLADAVVSYLQDASN